MGKLTTLARRGVGNVLRAVGLRSRAISPGSVSGLFLRHQVLPERPERPEGAGETGYVDLPDLSLKVAHAFECSQSARRRYYKPIADLIRTGERVLDVGCGDGTFLELVRDRGAAGIGVDLDPERVAACVGKGLESHCIRVQDIGQVIASTFDFVSMIHIIEHIVPSEALQILDSVARGLSESGRIFIVTPNIAHPTVQTNFWLDVTHIRPYPEALLNSIVATLGFPYFQSGDMTFATETWCYAFKKPEHALRLAAS